MVPYHITIQTVTHDYTLTIRYIEFFYHTVILYQISVLCNIVKQTPPVADIDLIVSSKILNLTL